MAEKDVGGALDLTVGSLDGGVVRLGIEAALPEISAWQERLAASDDPDLNAIARTLGELKAQLAPPGIDPVTIGAILMSLGDQVEQAAGNGVAVPIKEKLSLLGKVLGREGNEITEEASRY
jgi:hypothetical protein